MKRSAPLRRTPLKSKRATPRRRPAPRWDAEEWQQGNLILMARAGYLCERCGHADNLERHHRKRRRDGGDRLCNILLLCAGGDGCHRHVTEHPGEARRYGFIVSAYADPSVIPVLYRRREWMLLDDAGSLLPLPEPDLSDAHDVNGAPTFEK